MAYYMQGDKFPKGGRRGMRGRGRGQQYFATRTSDVLDSAVAVDPDDVFIVRLPKNYLGPAPVFKHQVLGGYSLDEDKNLRFDQSSLRFLDRKYLPTHGQLKVNLDLNAGFAKASRYSGSIEQTFHSFLRWILSNKEVLMTETTPPRLAADFIGIRNVFSTIMRTQYSPGEIWSIDAVE
nr:uncharacterized protein LOC128702727 [Cherax quadricarinatus]